MMQVTLIFLPLLLSVGVVWSRYTLSDEDGDIFRPFITNSQKKRICVDLCLAGLGGSPCGSDCADIMPQDLPIQSVQDDTTATQSKRNVTRNDACTVLCKNNLGQPLCVCDDVMGTTSEKKSSDVDFLQICSDFCIKYDYRLSGCQTCSVYKAITNNSNFSQQSLMSDYTDVDWYAWCQTKCGKGDGGAACNCDRLPL